MFLFVIITFVEELLFFSQNIFSSLGLLSLFYFVVRDLPHELGMTSFKEIRSCLLVLCCTL